MLPHPGLAEGTPGPPMCRFAVVLLPLALFACDGAGAGTDTNASGGDTSDTTDTSDTADTGSGGDTDPDPCNGNAPSVVRFEGSPGDNTTDNGKPIPAVNFFVAFTDPDGDVNKVNLQLWADDTVDDTVDTPAKPISEVGPVQMSVGTEPVPDCEGFEGSVVFALGITGRGLAFETEYQFAMAVIDTHEVSSEPAFLVYTTPAAVE